MLPGPNLTPAERRADGVKAPAHAMGGNCVRTLTRISVAMANIVHVRMNTWGDYESPPVRLKMAHSMCFGFGKRERLPEAKVSEVIRTLRNEVGDEIATRRQTPAARGDQNTHAQPTSRASGPTALALVELENIDYVLEEADLRSAANPPPPLSVINCLKRISSMLEYAQSMRCHILMTPN